LSPALRSLISDASIRESLRVIDCTEFGDSDFANAIPR
jgi:hypothetical protein